MEPNPHHPACSVCRRNLLRGERSETYIVDGERCEVCELCRGEALRNGWLRPDQVVEAAPTRGRRRQGRSSVFKRLFAGRENEEESTPTAREPEWSSDTETSPPSADLDTNFTPTERQSPVSDSEFSGGDLQVNAPAAFSRAVDTFNDGRFPRSIASIARSLGEPQVELALDDDHTAAVSITVAWELSWYRYWVDVSLDDPEIEQRGQGSDLSEVGSLTPNAVTDQSGKISFSGAAR